MEQLSALGAGLIDLLAVNFYPFKQTVARGAALNEVIENIDIGGPAMLRAAAKNYRDVTAVVDPADYEKVIEELRRDGRVGEETNFALAAKAFTHTADYDAAVAAYLREKSSAWTTEEFPSALMLAYEKVYDLRYGENPHQRAAFYREPRFGGLADIKQLHGKELSFNNLNDTNGALELLKEFEAPTVVACKHSVACGVGSAETVAEAYQKAYTADPVSIFGGIVAANREIDAETAAELNKVFIEIIIAPSFTGEALNILKSKKNIRVLQLDTGTDINEFDIKKVSGGILIQQTDKPLLPQEPMTVPTIRKPTEKELEDLIFAWKLVKHVKSNGIAIGKNGQSLGIGTGQVNRYWATQQAIGHAREHLGDNALKGAALASDAFFPFRDCVDTAAAAGITAMIQPGGSVNDQSAIDACNEHKIAMVFTGMRHFKH
jgi:phosphoribosylaminoimidazolecarboxamide formyltransferase/IMP cyclohydrolase